LPYEFEAPLEEVLILLAPPYAVFLVAKVDVMAWLYWYCIINSCALDRKRVGNVRGLTVPLW
jgi:hypothetical protein